MLRGLLCHHVFTTPLPPSQLHRDPRMYRSGPPFFCTRQDLFSGQYHTSISSFHKSGINIISIFQHSPITTTIISVLAPQHVILKKIPGVHFLPNVLSLISHCSHACCLQTFAIRRSMCWAGSSTIYVFGECLLPSGLYAKGLYSPAANSCRFPIQSFCFYSYS